MKIVKNTFGLFVRPITSLNEAIRSDGRTMKQRFSDFIKDIRKECTNIIVRIRNLKKANISLGIYHYRNGNLSDAKIRFHIIRCLYKNPPAEILYFLGRTYFEEGKIKKASKYLDQYIELGDKKYAKEADFTKKVIDDQAAQITEMPTSLIAHNFDLLAPIYNDAYIKDNPKCIHNSILKELKHTLSDISRPFGNKLLDLGCGTGYITKKLKESKSISYAVGVDISKEMLSIAKEQTADDLSVFDQTFNGSFKDYFSGKPENFDIILATQLLNHVHDYQSFISSCLKYLNKNGLLVFTFRVYPEKNGVIFDRYIEEFLHSGDEVIQYLKSLKDISLLVSEPLTFEIKNDLGLIMIERKN